MKTRKVINVGKRCKTLNEVRSVEKISKNLQSFLEMNLVQKKVHESYKLQDHAYE